MIKICLVFFSFGFVWPTVEVFCVFILWCYLPFPLPLLSNSFVYIFFSYCLWYGCSSAALFPSVPLCAFIYAIVHPLVLHFRFSRASAVLRAIVDLKSMLSRDFRAACESVRILMYLGFIVS